MKKCKCLKCGGIYDLPQPKSCPACGGMKFQSYFIKDPVAARPVLATPKATPKRSPAPVPRSSSAGCRTDPVKSAPAGKPVSPVAATGKFRPPKAPSKSFGQRLQEVRSALVRMSWKVCLKWIIRMASVVITVAVFSFVYMLSATALGGWWGGVLGIVVACAIVKFTVLK